MLGVAGIVIGRPVRGCETDSEVPSSQLLPERFERRLDLPVEMERHFAHQRRIRAYLIAELRHRTERYSDEIEGRSLSHLLFGDRRSQEIELCLLREWRGVIKRRELLGAP